MGNRAIREPDEPAGRMTREEYRAWVEQQPRGRFERMNGVVVAMAPERIAHLRAKARIWQALDQAVREAGIPCEALPDGATVEVDDNDYEPDAIVRCGPRISGDVTKVPDPLIVVEVLSPSSRTTDRSVKFGKYFKLPSLRHYLIVWPDKPRIVHHRRNGAGEIDTQVFAAGEILLDPPGISIVVEAIYAP